MGKVMRSRRYKHRNRISSCGQCHHVSTCRHSKWGWQGWGEEREREEEEGKEIESGGGQQTEKAGVVYLGLCSALLYFHGEKVKSYADLESADAGYLPCLVRDPVT